MALSELELNMLLDGPVMALPCQEGAGNFLDISGFGNDGVPANITRPILPSGLQVLGFNGTNSYVNCGNNASIKNITHAITVLFWVKGTSATAEYRRPLSKADWDVEVSWMIASYGTDGLRLGVYLSDDGSWNAGHRKFYITSVDVLDDIPHLFAFTFDGTNLKLFVDSSEDASPTKTYDDAISSIHISNTDLYIGTGLTSGARGNYHNGYIALPILIPGALSLTKLQNFYNRTKHYCEIFDGNILARELAVRQLAVFR